jgi:hypothetical protein
MSTQVSDRITIIANPTFGELFVASLILVRYQGPLLLVHAVFPLAGLFILLTPLLGHRLGIVDIVVAAYALLFTPFITVVAVWAARRNKLARGPFTYIFDSEGMHTSGQGFSQTIQWSAIPRVRRTKRFLLIFIARARAHCIPLRAVTDPDTMDRFCMLASARTDFR